MERRKITPQVAILLSLATGVVVAFGVQSCKVNKTLAANTLYVPVLITKTITKPQDTTKQKKRTDAETKEFLTDQYRANYNQFFAPEFNRMNNVIAKLSDGNKALSDIIVQMRARSIMRNDSMEADKKLYIKAALAAESRAGEYQKESIENQRRVIEIQREYKLKIQEQINSNNKISIVAIVCTLILGIFLLSLFLYCRSRFKSLEKRLSHV